LTGRILDETGYVRKLKESDTIEAEGRLENIEELLGAISNFDEAYPTEGLPVFLEQVALIQATDELDPGADSVKCLTAHSAKGLEFAIVFIAGLEDGLFPHSRSYHEPDGLEEERRLCYVGITRAKDRLFLSAAYRRSSAFWRRGSSLGGALPSRFLAEIPESLIEPADKESAKALRGEVEVKATVRPSTRETVDRDYEEMGEDWTVLPRAYEWAEEQEIQPPKPSGKAGRERAPSAYKVGEMVKHPSFGVGKIVKIQPAGGGDYFLQIKFEEEGQKLLSEEKAPLERAEGE
jgi:DNA helicase-2/ATP-dependent DNA helicase PcrA